MEILKALSIQGPNVWGTFPLLEVWVDARTEQQLPVGEWRAIVEGILHLAAPLVQAADLAPIDARRERLPAVWLENLARKLHRLCGVELPSGRVVSAAEAGIFLAGVPCEDEALGRPLLDVARGLLAAAIAAAPYDLPARLSELQALANHVCLGPSTRAIVDAARARGIPVRRLNVESLVQFGMGAHQRRICTAETDGTGIIAESIAQDKDLTKSLLRRAGIPVPEGRPVVSAEDAWQAACEIGVPVVVKPRDANHGRGVAIKLSLRERIIAAYEIAAAEGSGVLVEQYVAGTEHRLLVVGNRVVAVSRGEPETVVGDGVNTVAGLVEQANLDPRRGDEYARPMCKLKIDAIAVLLLEQQGLTPEAVPAAGTVVTLHRNGEYTTDVTDQLHPDVAARAILAARVVGLDVAGIDLMTHDISRPLEEQKGMLIEVNAGPGLQMHSEPQFGRARPVGAAIVGTLYPEGQAGRIPIVAVAAAADATTALRVTTHLLRQAGLTVGVSSSAGTFVGDRQLAEGSRTLGPRPAELFLNPLVETAVFEVGAATVYQEGLAFDDCDVAVVERTGVPVEAAASELHRPDVWRQIIVESVSPLGTAVIDADDPRAERLASCCRGSVLMCHPSERNTLLVRHRARGGKAIFLRDSTIWIAQGEQELAVAHLANPAVQRTTGLLAGVAAAWCAGMPLDLVGRGLDSVATQPHAA